jgi:hypothetical protein
MDGFDKDISAAPDPDVSGTLEPIIALLRQSLEDHARIMALAASFAEGDFRNSFAAFAQHRWEHAGAFHTLARWLHGPDALPDNIHEDKYALPKVELSGTEPATCVTQEALDEAMDRLEALMPEVESLIEQWPDTTHPVLRRISAELDHHHKEIKQRYQEFIDTGKCC